MVVLHQHHLVDPLPEHARGFDALWDVHAGGKPVRAKKQKPIVIDSDDDALSTVVAQTTHDATNADKHATDL